MRTAAAVVATAVRAFALHNGGHAAAQPRHTLHARLDAQRALRGQMILHGIAHRVAERLRFVVAVVGKDGRLQRVCDDDVCGDDDEPHSIDNSAHARAHRVRSPPAKMCRDRRHRRHRRRETLRHPSAHERLNWRAAHSGARTLTRNMVEMVRTSGDGFLSVFFTGPLSSGASYMPNSAASWSSALRAPSQLTRQQLARALTIAAPPAVRCRRFRCHCAALPAPTRCAITRERPQALARVCEGETHK